MAPARPGPTTWRRSIDRLTARTASFVLLIELVAAGAALAGAGSAGAALQVGVVVASQVVVLVVLLRRSFGGSGAAWLPAQVAAAVGLVAAATIGADAALPAFSLQLVPVNGMQALLVVAICSGRTAVRAGAVLALSAPVYVAARGVLGGASWVASLDEWVLPASASAVILVVLHALGDGADRADDLAEGERRWRAVRTAQRQAELALDEARRVLHDHVIAALHVFEYARDAAQVGRACAGALAAIGRAAHATTSSDLVDELRTATALRLDVDARDWTAAPPDAVLDALRDAASEALRNAERHGRATAATVRLRADEASVELVVVDDGSGLPPGWQPGFGVGRSILDRVADVGGRAAVTPGQDGGVEVRLVWPDVPAAPTLTAEPILQDRRTLALTIAAVSMVTTVYLALRHPGDHVALGLLGALATLGVSAVGGYLVGTSRTLGGRAVAAFGAAICALTWLGLVAAGPGALLSSRSWIIGALANVVALLAFQARARHVVPLIVAQVATVVLFAAREPDLGVLEPVGALVTPVVVGGFGILLGAGLRRSERQVARAEALLAAASGEVGAERRAEARRAHLADLTDDVVPFLDGGHTGCADPEEEARILAARCRDDLVLRTPLDPPTRVAIDAARRRGVVVTIRPAEREADFDPATWPLLREVVATCSGGSSATVLPPTAVEVGRVVVARDGARSTFPVGAAASSEPTTGRPSPTPARLER